MESKVLGAGLKAGLVNGAILLALLVAQSVIGLLSFDAAILFGCFVVLLALAIFFFAGRLAARFAGESAPGAGALAATIAAMLATLGAIILAFFQAANHPEQLTSFIATDAPQALDDLGTSSQIFAFGTAFGGACCICLSIGPIVAAVVGSFGGRVGPREGVGEEGVRLQSHPQPDRTIEQSPLPKPEGGNPELVQPKGKAPALGSGCVKAAFFVLAVAVICVATLVLIDLGDPIEPFGAGNGEGEVRNCIKSIFPGKLPSCSDYDGVSKPTYLNGTWIGDCSLVDVNNNCQ